MSRLIVSCTIAPYAGYCQHATEVVRYLLNAGYDIRIRPISVNFQFDSSVPDWMSSRFVWDQQPEVWELLLHPPNAVPSPTKKTAYNSMFEVTKLNDQQINALNAASVIIVPCEWNRACWKEIGVRPPIHVCNLGFDPSIFYPSEMNMGGPCVLGCAGRLMHGASRKGTNKVVKLFRRAFPTEQDVRLRVKGFADCPIEKCDDPRVEIIQRFMDWKELADWIHSLTCFVSAAKGEGFGLLQLQSMACGRPVICAVYGGLKEFCNHENSYACRYREILADERYVGLGSWSDIDDNHFIELMRSVYHDRKTAQAKGKLAAQQVAHLTWENSCRKLEGILKSVGAL